MNENDVTELLRAHRRLLEEFHLEPGPSGGHVAVARLTPGDLVTRLNELHRLEQAPGS